MTNYKGKNRRSRPHANPVKLVKPGDDDILCGKDRACALHKGSQRFRSVIDGYCETYHKATTKYDKMQITKEIYEVLSQNSRFLKLNDQEKVWEEITPLQARDKIGHALRFANHHTVTNATKSTTTTTTKSKRSKKVTGLIRQSSFSSSSATSSSTAAKGDNAKPSKAELVAELVEVAKDEPKVWDSLVDRLAHQDARAGTNSGPTPDQVASRHNRMASLADPVALENIAYAMESNTEDAALDDLITLLNNDEYVTEEDLQDVLDMAAAEADGAEVPPTVSISVVEKRSPGPMPMRCASSVHLSLSGTDDDMWAVMKEPLLEIDDDY